MPTRIRRVDQHFYPSKPALPMFTRSLIFLFDLLLYKIQEIPIENETVNATDVFKAKNKDYEMHEIFTNLHFMPGLKHTYKKISLLKMMPYFPLKMELAGDTSYLAL